MHINSRLRDGCIGHNDIFFLMLRVVAFLMLSINFDFVVDVVAIDVVVVVRLGLVVNVSVFCISLSINSLAASNDIEEALENFEKRIEFESDVSVITILICFIMILVFLIIIITFLIFHSKIPSTFLYIVVAVSIVGISIIVTLYGEELTVFCEKIIEYQMNMVNNNMTNIY